jgi:RNA polymerase sigma-70 factor, ECF subfamily
MIGAVEPSLGPEDARCVERVLEGEPHVFSALVGRHQEGCLRYALGMVGDGDVAADLVQDSFIKAYRTLRECREPARFGSWIFRIVRNRCLDHLKGKRIRTRWAAMEASRPSGALDPEMERFELRGALKRALARLTPEQRDAFLMKHLQDRSYEEMAAETGASVSALKMRVARAREILQVELEDDASM